MSGEEETAPGGSTDSWREAEFFAPPPEAEAAASPAPVDAAETAIRTVWSGVLRDPSDPGARLAPGGAGRESEAETRLRVNRREIAGAGAAPSPAADFELLDLLGEGGMGRVYEARQTSIDRKIALKVIKPHLARDAGQRAKFLAEAAVTGDLDHPNIVPVHDLGVDADGTLYYAMKRVHGTPWSKMIREVPVERNLEILLSVCNAVAFAHAKGVIHRDLKPQNVMLGEFGEVFVMDWGLAVSIGPGGKAEPLDRRTAAGGTPAYMAPEMALAEAEKIGAGSDVYLLGAILYEIVTGLYPHAGRTAVQCLLGAGRNQIQPSPVRGELVEIALRAMATEPAQRHASVRDFAQAIRDHQAHAQSLLLHARACRELEEAREAGDYALFARALFGFEQALALWPGRPDGAESVVEARRLYAECAFARADYDLAESLLRDAPGAPRELLVRVRAARDESRARQRRLRFFRRTAAALAAAVFIVLAVSSIWIREEKERAVAAERRAKSEREAAIVAREREAEQRVLAERRSAEARAAREEEARQRTLAEQATDKARGEERRALEALDALVAARTQEEEARAQAKAAGLVAAQAQEELSRSGLLRDNSWWTFDAAGAAARRKAEAERTGWPESRTVEAQGAAIELLLVPAGAFVMGSPAEEPGRAGLESLRRVELSSAFYLARRETTEALWHAVLGGPAPTEPERPKTEISWNDLRDLFLPAVNRFAPDGFVFRLPTEAEWEYACRAGTAGPYHTGPDAAALDRAGWTLYTGGRRPHPVGSLEPNAWGLLDMHGNAAEWCADAWDPLAALRASARDPRIDGDPQPHVVRGGSFLHLPEHCRSAYRSFARNGARYTFLGFRLALAKK